MAGRPKQGIDYAGWSVDIFDGDKKIDKLLDTHGWKGFGIYFFLCQRAYKTNGYFYLWGYDDCASTARKMGGGITSGTVKETVDYCLQVDLFDKRLFDRWGVLTSRGIQRRFWAVLSERRVKTVYEEYWLLKPEECKGLVKVSLKSDMQPTNDHLQDADAQMSYRKQSKVNNIYSAPPEPSFQNPALDRAFRMFILIQEKNGRQILPEQIEVFKAELMKLGENDEERIAIVNRAAAGGWKNFWPVPQKAKTVQKPAKNRFNNFHQREYDFGELEKQLLNS